MATNPYDRRRDDARHGEDRGARRAFLLSGGGNEWESSLPPSVLTLGDIDRLVAVKMADARIEARADAMREAEAAKREAQRIAWEQGHGQGRVTGAEAMHARYDEALGKDMHALHEQTEHLRSAMRLVAGEVSDDDAGMEFDTAKRILRDTTKAELLEIIVEAARTTYAAIRWHNRAAVDVAERGGGEVPF